MELSIPVPELPNIIPAHPWFGTTILLVDDFNVVCFSQLFLVGLGCRLLYFVCRFVVGWF